MNRTWKLVLAGMCLCVFNPAWAQDAKPAMATRAEVSAVKVPAEPAQSVSSVGSLAGGAGGGAAAASYARQADTSEAPCPGEPAAAAAVAPAPVTVDDKRGPGRLSTNATVGKQTQGATFGEKVNAGLHSAGGALAQGASSVAGITGGAVAGRCAKPVQAVPTQTPATTPAR